MTAKRKFAVIVLPCLLAVQFSSYDKALATPTDSSSCSNKARIVYVRGSGQDYEDSNELDALNESLRNNLSNDKYVLEELENTIDFLSSEPEYKSIAVFGDGTSTLNGLAAIIFQSSFGNYRKSVNSGKNLLEKYIRHHASQGSCVIPVGYSQGAQVVGEVVSDLESDLGLLSKIRYIGLLGDPKLDLYGVDIIPGKDIPWYRGNAVPLIQEGILENRSPYIPLREKIPVVSTSSWCYDDDLICTSNFAGGVIDNGHSKYPERAIPQMALEIANVINNPTGTVTKDLRPKDMCGAAKQDIVVLLDTSPLMRREASLFTDTPMYYGGVTGQRQPTAGEMLTRVGCGDTRVAVVGYGRAQDGPPQLLLDFTKDPKAYDALMKSLYQPNATGTYERTQFREGALAALDVGWRADAGKVIFAITDIAGSGEAGASGWRGWDDSRVRDAYLKDNLSQQLTAKAREKDAIILGVPVTHPYSGFTPAGADNASMEAHRYLGMMTSITGGYMWVKEVPNYWGYNFKYTLLDATLNHALQLREKTVVSVVSVRGKVGEPVTLKVSDTMSYLAAVTLRSDSKDFRWYVDCGNRAQNFYDSTQEITFTPSKAQKCKATVIVSARQRTGSGCYSSCPEPFPPYLYRSFPFDIDIKPADYVPKVPAKITEIEKTLYDDRVTYTWQRPSYEGGRDIAYVVRDMDGSVLAATTSRQLTITETTGADPDVTIEASGEDGKSEAVQGSLAAVIDLRTPPSPSVQQPEDDLAQTGSTDTADTESPAEVAVSRGETLSSSELLSRVDNSNPHVTALAENESAVAVLGLETIETKPLGQSGSASDPTVVGQESNVKTGWWGPLALAPVLVITIVIIKKLETRI